VALAVLIPSVAFTGLDSPAGKAGTAKVHEKFPPLSTTRLLPGRQIRIGVPLNVRPIRSPGSNPEPFAVTLLETYPTTGERDSTEGRIVKAAVPI
jgi:hypothetical protein